MDDLYIFPSLFSCIALASISIGTNFLREILSHFQSLIFFLLSDGQNWWRWTPYAIH